MKMKTVSVVVVLSLLLCSALSAPLKGKEDSQQTMFFGEDFHLQLPSLAAEVLFQPSNAKAGAEVVLMRGGSVVGNRAKLNSQLSHLILANVGEGDEGTYSVKNNEQPEEVRRITLIVRDCSNEQNIKYGENYHIQLAGVEAPITLEYRPSAVEANLTSRPPLLLMTREGLSRDGYQGRLSVNERRVTLNAVTGADEGSYTVSDTNLKIMRKVCLNVKEHQNFVKLPYAGTLKINLILNASMVRLFYTPDYDFKTRQILDGGQLTVPADLDLVGRISLDSSVVILDQVKASDVGQFKVTDILGFPVSNVYLEVDAYKLPSLYVAIIALVGFLVLLLLVCLLSCLVKQKKRAAKARAIEKIAQNAGKEDEGDAFRQVVKNITQFEESIAQSIDITEKSQSTEVDIKGLEVSSKEVACGNLETSDSGVEFNTTGLPLDTDTDVPDQILESEAETESVAFVPETKPSPPPVTPVTKPSPVPKINKIPEPAPEPKLTITKPVETKLSPIPSPVSKQAPSPIAKTPEPAKTPDFKTPEPKIPELKTPEPTKTPDLKTPDLKTPDLKTPELKTPEPAKTPIPVSPSPVSPKPTPPLTPVSKPTVPQLSTPEPAKLVTPAPELPKSVTPTPESSKPVTPTPESQKPVTPIQTPTPTPMLSPEPAPTTNGTPEPPAPESKPNTALAPVGLIESPVAKATPPKTPEVEVTAPSSPALEAKMDAPAEDNTATTAT
ncbi:uncharacterized protein LOC129857568 [Salvelinus fontinalis]|uniref:uncharacterized protein LOC129857568 n=1 Tax=Salvelinus fontinalis TaxID=8038 RepID=UPI0024869EB3|nr:uncharacterized protein LOC129857568 [Salvelinus fontinalis]